MSVANKTISGLKQAIEIESNKESYMDSKGNTKCEDCTKKFVCKYRERFTRLEEQIRNKEKEPLFEVTISCSEFFSVKQPIPGSIT